jgi:hypothetical protein
LKFDPRPRRSRFELDMVRRSWGAPTSSRERIGKRQRRLIRARFVPCAFRILRRRRFP